MKIEIELGEEQDTEDQGSESNMPPKYKPETNAQFDLFRKYLKMKNLTDDYAKYLGAKGKMMEKKMGDQNKPCPECDQMPCQCDKENGMMED